MSRAVVLLFCGSNLHLHENGEHRTGLDLLWTAAVKVGCSNKVDAATPSCVFRERKLKLMLEVVRENSKQIQRSYRKVNPTLSAGGSGKLGVIVFLGARGGYRVISRSWGQ